MDNPKPVTLVVGIKCDNAAVVSQLRHAVQLALLNYLGTYGDNCTVRLATPDDLDPKDCAERLGLDGEVIKQAAHQVHRAASRYDSSAQKALGIHYDGAAVAYQTKADSMRVDGEALDAAAKLVRASEEGSP